jgi:hypothetical protein
MFDFLKKKAPKPAPIASVTSFSNTPDSKQQLSGVRRELIRVVLKDTLRLHGIPLSWLACEVIIIARTAGEEDLHIQLVIMKWNEQLLRYASALQQQLLLALDRFEPSVSHAKYIVSWRFSADFVCPFAAMPDPLFWLQSAKPQVEKEPLAILDRRQSRRPSDAKKPDPLPAVSFERRPEFLSTQILPLL